VLTLPASVRIYVAAEAVDLRRGFDGLAAATRSLIRQDPLLCGGPRYVV
jgi:transposase